MNFLSKTVLALLTSRTPSHEMKRRWSMLNTEAHARFEQGYGAEQSSHQERAENSVKSVRKKRTKHISADAEKRRREVHGTF